MRVSLAETHQNFEVEGYVPETGLLAGIGLQWPGVLVSESQTGGCSVDSLREAVCYPRVALRYTHGNTTTSPVPG